MKFARMWFCCALLAPVAVAAAQQLPTPAESQTPAPVNSATPPKDSKCTIQGQTVQEPGGQPLKKVTINLASDEVDGTSYKAVSDAEGRFKIEDIKPGRYILWMERSGFLDAGKQHRRRPKRTLSLSPGQEIKDLLFRMQPTAVITGKILDGDGDPMPAVTIRVTHWGVNSWRHAYGGGAHTNDLGEFRVSDLRPGRYLFQAAPLRRGLLGSTAHSSNGSRPATNYPTYYAGATEKGQAVPIEVRAGDETPINLSLASGPAFRVSGSIGNLPDAQGAEVSVELHPKDVEPWAMQEVDGTVKKDGTFEVQDVLPGTYEVTLVTTVGSEPETLRAAQTIQVKDTDVDGVRLTTAPSAEVHGQVRTEDGQKLEWAGVSVMLNSGQEDSGYQSYWEGSQQTMLKRNGSFEMKNVPRGNYHVTIDSRATAMRDYFVKSISLGGKDVTDSGFTAAGTLSLDILLSSKGATLDGTVMDSNNQPVADAVIVAVPSPGRRQRHDVFAQETSDQLGRFTFRGMDPGDYTVMALEALEDDPWEPDFLKANLDHGQSVTLKEGERKTIPLKVIPSDDDSAGASAR